MWDKEDSYNPTTTLLNSDVGIERVATGPGKSTWMVSVWVRNPKELKGQQEVAVKCFATGGKNCPVRAVQKVLDMEQGGDRPFASKKDGTTMTKKWLNKTLKGLLLMPAYVATETVLARHDGHRFVELKHFTNQNR